MTEGFVGRPRTRRFELKRNPVDHIPRNDGLPDWLVIGFSGHRHLLDKEASRRCGDPREA